MSVYEQVTNRILSQLEQGVIPWRKEWKSSGNTGLPYNVQSQKCYRGINILLLMSSAFSDARWMTYKQALDMGGNVRKGEKGTRIVFWSLMEFESPDSDPKKVPFMREYTVFNYDQIDGIKKELTTTLEPFEPLPAADALSSAYLTRAGVDLKHGGNRAYYHPVLDYIQMPEQVDFTLRDAYYSTLFHECGHSTGHKTRLDRGVDGSNSFGSEMYSKEELVAEFTAAFLCASVGISNERLEVNHAAYIQGWMTSFKNDPKLLVIAAQRAQRAADYIQNVSFNVAATPELMGVAA